MVDLSRQGSRAYRVKRARSRCSWWGGEIKSMTTKTMTNKNILRLFLGVFVVLIIVAMSYAAHNWKSDGSTIALDDQLEDDGLQMEGGSLRFLNFKNADNVFAEHPDLKQAILPLNPLPLKEFSSVATPQFISVNYFYAHEYQPKHDHDIDVARDSRMLIGRICQLYAHSKYLRHNNYRYEIKIFDDDQIGRAHV